MQDYDGERPDFGDGTGRETDDDREASFACMSSVNMERYKDPVRAKALYVEGEGAKITFLNKTIVGEDKGLEVNKWVPAKVQLVAGEAGLCQIYGDYRYGGWKVKSPFVRGDVGFEISDNPKFALYAKASVLEMDGDAYIPLFHSANKLDIGGALDFGSIGGGVDLDMKSRQFKFGLHLGIGFDCSIGVK